LLEVRVQTVVRGLQDSPSSKLLYAKDIPRYRQMVRSFYKTIEDTPTVTDQQITDFMHQHSQVYNYFIYYVNRTQNKINILKHLKRTSHGAFIVHNH